MHANIAFLFPHNEYTQYFFYYFTQNSDICFINFSLWQKLIDHQLKNFDTHVVFSSYKLEKKLWITIDTSQYKVIRLDSLYGKYYYLWHSFLWYIFISLKRYKKQFLDKSIFLFTSGSTGNPKLVEFKVSAIKKNIEGWMEYVELEPYNTMLCSLPYFHSFGLNTGLVFPLLQHLWYTSTSIEFYFNYNLTNPESIAQTIREYGIQHITLTPYFLEILLNASLPGQLQSLESVFVGGDFSNNKLVQKFKKIIPYAKYQKGYGLTECFPIISILPTSDNTHNIQSDGKILSHIHYKVLDNNGEYHDNGKGILFINIESTIRSYYDEPLKTTEINGKLYFNTEDHVYVNTDGHITILGRSRRIIKKWNEMINLEYIQEQLNQQFEGICIGKNEHIYFFTPQDINLGMLNTYIMNLWLSNMYLVSEIITIDKIPMIGVGKVNYQGLEELINH